MNKKKLLVLMTILSMTFLITQAQEILSSCGAFYENANISFAFTTGEFVTQTCEGSIICLTQGFHQPKFAESLPVVPIGIDYSITAYPNPSVDYVILRIVKPEGLSYALLDINGRILEQKKIVSDHTEIQFNNREASIYFIRVMDDKSAIKLIKIIKE